MKMQGGPNEEPKPQITASSMLDPETSTYHAQFRQYDDL
jgi:hypothetical protein